MLINSVKSLYQQATESADKQALLEKKLAEVQAENGAMKQ